MANVKANGVDTTLTLPTSKWRVSALQKQDSTAKAPGHNVFLLCSCSPVKAGLSNSEGYCLVDLKLQV